jgi:hypothetical protein
MRGTLKPHLNCSSFLQRLPPQPLSQPSGRSRYINAGDKASGQGNRKSFLKPEATEFVYEAVGIRPHNDGGLEDKMVSSGSFLK